MSGIYIPGMEMPTSCEKCPCRTSDAFGGLGCRATGYIPLRKANEDRPGFCPLISVPAHGRLIDADAVAECFWDGQCYFTDAIKRKLQNAPTIIPADGKDTNVPTREEGE